VGAELGAARQRLLQRRRGQHRQRHRDPGGRLRAVLALGLDHPLGDGIADTAQPHQQQAALGLHHQDRLARPGPQRSRQVPGVGAGDPNRVA